MSYNHSGKWASLVMTVDGTLAVADSQASVKMPFDGYIESLQMKKRKYIVVLEILLMNYLQLFLVVVGVLQCGEL